MYWSEVFGSIHEGLFKRRPLRLMGQWYEYNPDKWLFYTLLLKLNNHNNRRFVGLTFTLPLRHSPHFTRLSRASTTSDRLWQRFGTWLQVLSHLLRRLTFIRQRNEFLPARHQARLSVDRYTVHFLLSYAPIYPALQPRRVSLLHRRIEANEVGTLSKWRKRNQSSCLLRNALEVSGDAERQPNEK